MSGQPTLHRWGLVRCVVVKHQTHGRPLRLGRLDHLIDRVEKLDELFGAMMTMALVEQGDPARLPHA